MIMNFAINETTVPQVEKYDNQGAHNAIKSMMQRKETLSIRLYTDKENYPCIWVESYNVAGFKQLIESGKRVQFVPLFREVNNYISATSAFLRGKIFFRVERTDEILDYLREKEAII